MQAYIRSVGAYVPEKIITNDDLAKTIDTNDEWIFSHTGIKERRVAAENEAASDLGYAAVRHALDNISLQDPGGEELKGSDIDLVLLATSTPDYPGLPSTACIVQDKLGAENAGAMDLVAACTGFIYGLETAKNFVLSGAARNVLVVGAEVYSKIINWKDRSTCVLFGDGAGAVVVSPGEKTAGSGIFSSVLGSRGSGVEHLLRPAGGTRTPYVPGITPEEDLYLHMNGRQVYVFAVQAITDSINRLLEINSVSMDEIDHVIPHQANKRIIEAACKRNGWPEEKFFMNIRHYANTSAASIPIAMEEMQRKGLLKRGDKVLTIGFGSGLTFGGNYFIW
ncbi:beta-ketoacyl-ACP synthase III [Salinispira pacifica]|uniref:Beta-ketoacyl-[acyl-carrier-protein] synthase III n=1 Tax=Salinispira pacifica TaxID=1307761 RepID=V5WDC0_9SPIO|nr:beta-ketoacyl-ACP synthase III [Salinispira pacifica]AHC13595.1 3-oxoacyl-[acyl-carrier-protein] synthase, KASIII [Salinispira pacifica]